MVPRTDMSNRSPVRRDTMYVNCAGLGTCLAVGTLLEAFIRRTSQSPETDVKEMLSRCLRMQLAFGNGL